MSQYVFDYDRASDVSILTHEVAITLDTAKAYIDQLLNSFDIDACPVEHLNIIANLLGYPVDKEEDSDFVRRSLRNTINMYKAKGTEDSIKILFYNLGFNVEIFPQWTADFIERVKLSPPYIKVFQQLVPKNAYKPGYNDVMVINPDRQYDTSTDAYQYLNPL
jgi:hypothetical protein